MKRSMNWEKKTGPLARGSDTDIDEPPFDDTPSNVPSTQQLNEKPDSIGQYFDKSRVV
jgi:hypothetical protein